MLNDNMESLSSGTSYKKRPVRYLLLGLIVLIAFANEYAFNNPQALEETLYERLHIS